jgi:hypothetical protein
MGLQLTCQPIEEHVDEGVEADLNSTVQVSPFSNADRATKRMVSKSLAC